MRLCHTLVERTWDPASACTHEWFYRDWREDLTNTNGLANYGHVAETAWFSATIAAYTGEARYRDFAQASSYRRVDPEEVTGSVPKGASCGHAGCGEYVAITCQR